MADEKIGSTFWTTLPGLLTGLAAVLTAAGGIFLGLHQSGGGVPVAKQDAATTKSEAAAPTPVPANGATPRVEAAPSGVAAQPMAASPSTDNTPAHTVRIIQLDGTVLWSFEDKFNWSSELRLDSGQSIPLAKIKLIDFLSWDDGKAKMRVTLANGNVMEAVSSTFPLYGGGKNDLGTLQFETRQIKRIVLPH